MNNTQQLLEHVQTLSNNVLAANEKWHLLVSLLILVFGFLVLEALWRAGNRQIETALTKKHVKDWAPYLYGFLPSIRLASAALLLRIAEFPLVIPEKLLVLIRGLEIFLIVLAIMLFTFQLARLLDLIGRALPARARKKFSDTILNNLKSILRITGIILAAVFFAYTQKQLFPTWVGASPWWRYVSLVVIFTVLYVGGRLLSAFLLTMTVALKDTEEKARLRLVLNAAVWPVRLLLIAIAVYAFQDILTVPKAIDRFAEMLANVLGTLVVIIFLYRLLDVGEYELTRFVRRDDNEFDMNLVQMARLVARVLLVVIGCIYLLKAATGKPMTTLLAGLGIGGLAVALAAQDTLKNLFGSFMIMIDEPFVVGDWIFVEGTHATVEEIGFRCTRIRTFPGHVISIPNEKMATINIENIQRRPYVRRHMNITITYDTPPDKVERAVTIIKDILRDREDLHPDYPAKVHFNEFNDASLNILIVYWFKKNDYWASIAFNEMINFEIMRAFENEGIEFAFPTTTTYLAQDDRRPLNITVTGDVKPKTPDREE